MCGISGWIDSGQSVRQTDRQIYIMVDERLNG